MYEEETKKKKRDRDMMRRINFMTSGNRPPGATTTPGTSAGQPPINPTAIQVARDIEEIAAHQHQVGGGDGQYQQMIERMPAPRGYPSMQMNQRLQQRMPPPMVSVVRPGMTPSMSEGMYPPPPGGPRLLTPHQSDQVQIQLTRLNAAKSPEERDMMMREMEQDPLVSQTILRAFQRSGQQPPPQLQQQAAWSDQMMSAAGQGPPTRPTMQPQQYYGGGQPRMMQQSQPPGQGFQQQMQMPPDMNGPPSRHMGGYGNPYGGDQQSAINGGIYGNAAGLGQPISPQQQAAVGGGSSMMASSNLLNQVRSPQTLSMASPLPGNIHSPHIGASSMMPNQQQHQLPANIMADPSGNDMMGGGFGRGGGRSVRVNNIDAKVTNGVLYGALKDYFGRYGACRVNVVDKPPAARHAYIHFQQADAARRAINNMPPELLTRLGAGVRIKAAGGGGDKGDGDRIESTAKRRRPSSANGPGGGHQQPMIHHQTTNSPNVALAPTMNQRTPPSNVMYMPQAPQNIVNRSPMMNNLASAPNGSVGMNNIDDRPSMGVFSPDGANANGGKSSGINGGSAASSDIETEDQNLSARAGSSSSTTPAPEYESSDKMVVPDGDLDKPTTSSGGDAAATESKSLVKIVKKVFTVEELSAGLMPILERFEPDNFDVIKNPMDLSTIRSKLLDGGYTEPWQFCDDMWLMFDNAWANNRKASKGHKYCTKLSVMFVEAIDPVMRSLGYCCGRKLAFTPLALVCYGQSMCSIPREAMYYCYEENKSQFGVAPERYTYCEKCFEELPGDSINMSEDPNSSDNLILKSSFKLLKNDQIEYEPMVECVDCGRKWHKVCALHLEQIYPAGFVCDTCVRTRGRRKGENRFTAKRLPQCKLSLHLEKRVGEFLRKKLTPETPAGEVTIRVLSSSDKEVEVKPHMRSKFCPPNGEMKEKYPYRAKAIFAFEVIDGVEVCFFGLHVQEYGSSCSPPNQRRVYIAYLDSVHFFTPKIVRTRVYHEILLGYLEYVKRLGYTMAYIWACPPSEGDDYIFHCHPREQKIPKPKRLQEWYKKMLDKAIVERVVTDYKDIYDFYQTEEPLTSVTELPLFEGDYWSNIIEECIREVDAEEAERRREAEAATFAKSKSKSTGSKKSKKNMSGTGDDLTDKVMAALEKHKEVFFVVRLYSKQTAASMHPTQDPDSHITCEFMDGRGTFLSTARDRHWEFSSLRRAKYSTMALCYELHTQGSDLYVWVYTCDTCQNTNAKWHCGECEDFDQCQGCYEKSPHEHKMEPIKSIIGADDSPSNQEQGAQNPRDRNESIQCCIQSTPASPRLPVPRRQLSPIIVSQDEAGRPTYEDVQETSKRIVSGVQAIDRLVPLPRAADPSGNDMMGGDQDKLF